MITVADINATNPVSLTNIKVLSVVDPAVAITCIFVDSLRGKIYWVDSRNGFHTGLLDPVSLSNVTNVTAISVILPNNFLLYTFSIDELNKKIYFTDNSGGLLIGNIDQEDSTTVTNASQIKQSNSVNGVWADSKRKKIYWLKTSTQEAAISVSNITLSILDTAFMPIVNLWRCSGKFCTCGSCPSGYINVYHDVNTGWPCNCGSLVNLCDCAAPSFMFCLSC